jgi:hypothetical protein
MATKEYSPTEPKARKAIKFSDSLVEVAYVCASTRLKIPRGADSLFFEKNSLMAAAVIGLKVQVSKPDSDREIDPAFGSLMKAQTGRHR